VTNVAMIAAVAISAFSDSSRITQSDHLLTAVYVLAATLLSFSHFTLKGNYRTDALRRI
jgi:hypothetical protein